MLSTSSAFLLTPNTSQWFHRTASCESSISPRELLNILWGCNPKTGPLIFTLFFVMDFRTRELLNILWGCNPKTGPLIFALFFVMDFRTQKSNNPRKGTTFNFLFILVFGLETPKKKLLVSNLVI